MDKPEILAKAHEYQRKVAASLIAPAGDLADVALICRVSAGLTVL